MRREYTMKDMFLDIFTGMFNGTYDSVFTEAEINDMISSLVHHHEGRKSA